MKEGLAGGTGLVPIGDLSEHSVVCALANVMRDDPDGQWNQPGSLRNEFTLTCLATRLGYAERVFKDWSTCGCTLIRNPVFLQNIGIPINFIDDPELGRCVNAVEFDQIHGFAAARTAIAHLKASGSTDTRTYLSSLLPNPNMEAGTMQLEKHFPNDALFLSERGGAFVFKLNRIPLAKTLGLLAALLEAARSGKGATSKKIRPFVPRMDYEIRPVMLRMFDPTEQMYVSAIRREYGAEIELTDKGFEVRGIPRETAQNLVFASQHWLKTRWLGFDWIASGVGTAASVLLSSVLGLLVFFEVDLLAISATETMLPMMTGAWLATLAAPLRLGYRVMTRGQTA